MERIKILNNIKTILCVKINFIKLVYRLYIKQNNDRKKGDLRNVRSATAYYL